MYTHTPRDGEGKFESWNGRVNDAGEYNGQDAAVAVLVMAAGAALWKLGEWAWEKITE